jgi:hypothetical protein
VLESAATIRWCMNPIKQLVGHVSGVQFESGVILARCRGIVGVIPAHCALEALWAIGAVIGSVFGA